MILENVFLKELKEIFKDNKQDYVWDETAIDSDMLKVVFVENNVPLGYAVVYFGKDFIENEGYDISIDNLKDMTAYIFQIITKKGYENRGIATEIITYITKKLEDYEIYSCVDVTNIPSLRCHEKCGFKKIIKFNKKYDNEIDELYIMKK